MQVDRLCLFLHFCLHCTGVLHQTPALGSVYSCAFVFSVWECFIGPQHLAVVIVALLSSAYRSASLDQHLAVFIIALLSSAYGRASSDPNTWQVGPKFLHVSPSIVFAGRAQFFNLECSASGNPPPTYEVRAQSVL